MTTKIVDFYRNASMLIPPPKSNQFSTDAGQLAWKKMPSIEKLTNIFNAAVSEPLEVQQELRNVIFDRIHDLDEYKEFPDGKTILEIAKKSSILNYPKAAVRTFTLKMGDKELVLPIYYKAALAKDFHFFEKLFYSSGYKFSENTAIYEIIEDKFGALTPDQLEKVIRLWDGTLSPYSLGAREAEDEAIDQAIELLETGRITREAAVLDEAIELLSPVVSGFLTLELDELKTVIINYIKLKSMVVPDESNLEEIKFLLDRFSDQKEIVDELKKHVVFVVRSLIDLEFKIPMKSEFTTTNDVEIADDSPLASQKSAYIDLLENLKIQTLELKTLQNFDEFLSLFTNLKSLDFSNPPTGNELAQAVLDRVAALPHLTSLKIEPNNLQAFSAFEKSSNLKKLIIPQGHYSIPPANLGKHLKNFIGNVHLEHFDLSKIPLSYDDELAIVEMLRVFKDLKVLNLVELGVGGATLDVIKELTQADVMQPETIKPDQIPEQIKEMQLEILNLGKNPLISGQIAKLRDLTSLKELGLQDCELKETDFDDLKFPKLEVLDLSSNVALEDKHIENLVKQNPNLKVLKVKDCLYVTNDGLRHLIGSRVETLDYSEHVRVARKTSEGYSLAEGLDEETGRILNQCHSLKVLILSKYDPVPPDLREGIQVKQV